jgi:hypothetical protein
MSDSKLDHEMSINIRLKPRRIIKGVVLLVMLVAVFYLGRFSAGPEEALTSASTSTAEETTLEAPVATAASTETEKESWTAGVTELFTGFVTGLLPDFSDEKETETKETEESATTTSSSEKTDKTDSSSNVTSAETVVNTTNTTDTAAATPAAEETVLTSYSKVAVSLNDVKYDWKGTWGKITKIDYTIRNNEEGTVKPYYLIMLVEGYDTEDNMIKKKISIPLSGQTIKAGGVYTQMTNVPQGFAYNQITAGDLADVRTTLMLYDSADKLMGQFSGGFNLQGS